MDEGVEIHALPCGGMMEVFCVLPTHENGLNVIIKI